MNVSARVLRASWVLAVLLAPARAGNVIVVDTAGFGDHVQIQPAVDAATDGDTILVRAGLYAGFVVTDKGLSIVAAPNSLVQIGGTVRVVSLASSRDLVLAGLTVQGSEHGLVLAGNTGSVRVQACELHGADGVDSMSGAWVSACADVVFSDCWLRGGRMGEGDCGHGLRALSSFVAFYDTRAEGGRGFDVDCNLYWLWGGNGGAGAWATSSRLFASNSDFLGGDGGNGSDNCMVENDGGSGGPGLNLRQGSRADLLDTFCLGGQGGQWGCGSFGCGQVGYDGLPTSVEAGSSLFVLTGSSRVLEAPTVVHEPPDTIRLTVHGIPGDAVFVRISRQTKFVFILNQFGVGTIPDVPAPVVLNLGVVPATGTLSRSIPSFPLGAGIDSRTYFLQPLVRATSGLRYLGTPSSLVVLDSAF
jgi:hypothetical protein